MIKQLVRAYRLLFPSRRYKALIAGLILLTALVPVTELLVARLFSSIIVDGPDLYRDDRDALIIQVVIFFGAFAVTRTTHHLVRAFRVLAVRRALAADPRSRTPSTESWEWALAFELTGVITVVVQAAVFSAFFFYLKPTLGIVNVVVIVASVTAIAWVYRRQLLRQQAYLVKAPKDVEAVPIGQRVQSRIVDAELGSVVASIGLLIMLALVLLAAVQGTVPSTDAIVLFLGFRLLYGQIGNMSAHLMRFARASARTMT